MNGPTRPSMSPPGATSATAPALPRRSARAAGLVRYPSDSAARRTFCARSGRTVDPPAITRAAVARETPATRARSTRVGRAVGVFTAASCHQCRGGRTGRGACRPRRSADVVGVAEQSSRPVDEDHLGCLFDVVSWVFAFDELAVFEAGPGSDEGDQVWCVHGAPPAL